MQATKQVKCPHCEKEFSSKGIHNHVKAIHQGIKFKGCLGARWKAKRLECEKCKKQISNANFKRHFDSCKGVQSKKAQLAEDYRVPGTEIFRCPECGQECHKKAICFHVWKHGIGKDHDPFKGIRSTPWNKGLTKDSNSSLRQAGETYKSKNHKTWCEGKTKRTDERVAKSAEQVRSSVKSKIENDGWHFYPRTAKAGIYKDAKFHSGWEIKFAQWLDERGIEWVRTTDSFPYEWNGSTHNYFPDFYLPLADVYVEIKGQANHRDECKWKALPNLIVLEGQDLREAGVL